MFSHTRTHTHTDQPVASISSLQPLISMKCLIMVIVSLKFVIAEGGLKGKIHSKLLSPVDSHCKTEEGILEPGQNRVVFNENISVFHFQVNAADFLVTVAPTEISVLAPNMSPRLFSPQTTYVIHLHARVQNQISRVTNCQETEI